MARETNPFSDTVKSKLSKFQIKKLHKDKFLLSIRDLVAHSCMLLERGKMSPELSKEDYEDLRAEIFRYRDSNTLWYTWSHTAVLGDYITNGATDRYASFVRYFDPTQFEDPINACDKFFMNSVTRSVLLSVETQETVFRAKSFNIEELIGQAIEALRVNPKDFCETVNGKHFVKDLSKLPDSITRHIQSIRTTRHSGLELVFENKPANREFLANLLTVKERLTAAREKAASAEDTENRKDKTITIEFVTDKSTNDTSGKVS